MNRPGWRTALFRERDGHGAHRVTFAELFFDLVFVFAVTQLSHLLLNHFSLLGLAQTGLLLLAVWWAWVFTSWATNWLRPDHPLGRLALFGLMLLGLALSTSLPQAFGARGLVFAGAYVLMQVGRSLFMVWMIPASHASLRRNFLRISLWALFVGLFWIAGALREGEERLLLWALAVLLDYLSPSLRFRVPGLGASSLSDWNVEGGHLSERCGLFVIIALGESILVTGASFDQTSWSPASVAAFLSAFLSSVAMWWLYFHRGAEHGSERISHMDDPGRLARLTYTYLHLPIIAGIILAAVADEMVLAHPHGAISWQTAAGLLGAPMLFLCGAILFKRSIRGWLQLSHLGGFGALLLSILLVPVLDPLQLSLLTTAILIIVALWEALSLRDQTA